jgi:uncharacterized membrane protein
MLQLHLLRILLALVGIIHFLDPYSLVNAIPLFIPSKLEIIYFTGALEWMLVVGLSIKKYRPKFAKVTAAYFALLVPIQIYVAIYSIPLFGLGNPVLLWMRVIFQLLLIWWAYSLRKV